MKREKIASPDTTPRFDEPRPASQRLISQLQAAVRRAQERKENNNVVSPLAAFAAELDAKARGRDPVEFLGSLGKRDSRAAETSDEETVE